MTTTRPTRHDGAVATPVIIDSDGGVDDAAALWAALTHPAFDVVAVTAVHGNVAVDVAATNLAHVLHAAGRADIAVAPGAAAPLGPAPDLGRPHAIHGDAGAGPLRRAAPPGALSNEPARERLARLAAERPGEVEVITLGPLTNIAAVMRADPGWAGRVKALTVMGGSTRTHGGNALPAAEANIARDPVAAAAVVAGAWARPPLLVGLDVTLRATLTHAEFELLANGRTAAALDLAEPLAHYRRFGSVFTPPGECPCHDLLAVLAAAEPGLVDGPVLPLAVDTGASAAWGATVADVRVPAFERAAAADPERARLATGPPAAPVAMHPWRIGLEVDVARFRALVAHLFGA
jgi:purine nucleosidase